MVMELSEREYMVRGLGYLRSVSDIENVVVGATVGDVQLVNGRTGTKERIGQVLGNLLDNALEACGASGEITVSLSEEKGGVTLRLRLPARKLLPHDRINRTNAVVFRARRIRVPPRCRAACATPWA